MSPMIASACLPLERASPRASPLLRVPLQTLYGQLRESDADLVATKCIARARRKSILYHGELA